MLGIVQLHVELELDFGGFVVPDLELLRVELLPLGADELGEVRQREVCIAEKAYLGAPRAARGGGNC
jgi:hypothetical protein